MAKKSAKADEQSGEYRTNLVDHKKRCTKVWADRQMWQRFYDDAYEFAIPFRRPATRMGKAIEVITRVFDATAIESSFRAAGQLHADLFPPEFFKLAPGAIAKVAMSPRDRRALALQLEQVSTIAAAFFETGEFAAATSEMCIDLMVGTATLLPLQGDAREPVRFVCVPFDEIAIETDGYGKVTLICWRTRMTRRAIKDAFPKGNYPKEFEDNYTGNGIDQEVEINQDFYFDRAANRWTFCVWLATSETPIVEEDYKTQPMAVPRYHRVPGEPYGRGPILLALPTIKTLNKAVELTLKAAAIQMLGIWGYRPGALNPDNVRLGPGEFWPMQHTGGVLGPDVTRLDTSSGKVDVGQIVTQELRLQVQSMLGDDRLPERGATPVSATEIMARMKRIQQNYMGAWARIVNEVHPVIVRRVLEILYNQKIKGIMNLDIDQLLIRVDVLSPITSAIKAAAHSRIVDFIQLVIALKGNPMAAELVVKVDDALERIATDELPASLIVSPEERKQLKAMMAKAAAQIAAAQMKGKAGNDQGAPAEPVAA